jgi:ABC-type nickel/cobalt efflux system permease component RcnA
MTNEYLQKGYWLPFERSRSAILLLFLALSLRFILPRHTHTDRQTVTDRQTDKVRRTGTHRHTRSHTHTGTHTEQTQACTVTHKHKYRNPPLYIIR